MLVKPLAAEEVKAAMAVVVKDWTCSTLNAASCVLLSPDTATVLKVAMAEVVRAVT